jgi:hypothetical protein
MLVLSLRRCEGRERGEGQVKKQGGEWNRGKEGRVRRKEGCREGKWWRKECEDEWRGKEGGGLG